MGRVRSAKLDPGATVASPLNEGCFATISCSAEECQLERDSIVAEHGRLITAVTIRLRSITVGIVNNNDDDTVENGKYCTRVALQLFNVRPKSANSRVTW